MKRYVVLFVVALCLFFVNQGKAQDYGSAIGLRLGYPLSLTYKTFINDNGAIEVFGGLRGYSYYSWINVGAAYQVHKPIEGVDGLMWYFGGGASVFFWTYKSGFPGDNSSSTTFGILGNLGLDYKFPNSPINISADWMPMFFINGYLSGFGGGYGALAVRYTLN
ncbi:MAG: hypothetical protein KDD04_09555 [Sinomicrobium sp.]|nr:hypothetical protein [Sinomicrobium sp.]